MAKIEIKYVKRIKRDERDKVIFSLHKPLYLLPTVIK